MDRRRLQAFLAAGEMEDSLLLPRREPPGQIRPELGLQQRHPFPAAAAVTERIGLFPNILLAPAYNPVLLAKVTASLDQVAGGRLSLGLGVGGRPDDFVLTGRPFSDRGRRFDADLELLHQAWAGEPVAGSSFPVGPATTRGRIPLLIGGQPELAAPRAARWQAGFTIGGAPPEMAGGAIQAFKAAWQRAGGEGTPRIVVLSYFSLGEEHIEESLRNLRTYYGFLGDWAEAIASGAARTPQAVRERAAAFEELGVDELVFDPTVANLDQVDRLADAVGAGAPQAGAAGAPQAGA